ncbi:MAG: phage holin family protein [Candidatus Limnocylindria bacterium]
MTTGDTPRRRENAFTLVRRLVTGGIDLAKLNIQQGREEIAQNLGQLRGGIVLLAIAAGLVLTFLIALVAFIMSVLVVIGLWWVALILLLLLLVIAGLLAWQGIGRVRSTNFTPDETIATVKEEIEWAKSRLLRRG